MTAKTAGQIQEFGGHVQEFAGVKVREKVMAGSETIAKTSNKEKVALWMKEAIDRLDICTTPEKCSRIMGACGHNCAAHNDRMVGGAASRRLKYPTEKAFLEAEVKRSAKYTRVELQGKTIVQYYTPHDFSTPRRCFCSLMYSLPEGINASPTYCQCSRGFVEKYWEAALGRPVEVEVVETCLSGADECKFIIHL